MSVKVNMWLVSSNDVNKRDLPEIAHSLWPHVIDKAHNTSYIDNKIRTKLWSKKNATLTTGLDEYKLMQVWNITCQFPCLVSGVWSIPVHRIFWNCVTKNISSDIRLNVKHIVFQQYSNHWLFQPSKHF